MRIAICTDQYLPMLSGAVDSIVTLATQLTQNGHEVRIYAPRLAGATPESHVFLFPAYAVPGTAHAFIIVLPIGAMKDMKAFKPDVIHTHFVGVAGFFAWYASRRLGVPLVGTDHTLPADYLHYVHLDYRPFRWFVRRFSSWFYNHCLLVTAPSTHVLDELKEYGTTRPVELISNPIRTDLFRALSDATLKQTYGIGEKAILVFGRLAVEKNLDAALNIFESIAPITDAQLVFIGDGPYREILEKNIAEKNLTGRVLLLGALRGEALVEAINACEVFLITSLSDTQSMAMLEAMACELPVVAIRAGGLPEYVAHGVSGYVVEPQNTKGFADHLMQLLDDASRAKDMGKKGREIAMRFAPEATAAQFEAIYERAIKSATLPS